MNYQPGLHIIAEFSSLKKDLLQKSAHVQQLLHTLINKHGLNKLGEVFHDFDPAGFTAVLS
jgi:S-adenosylmethionine decarboxylase